MNFTPQCSGLGHKVNFYRTSLVLTDWRSINYVTLEGGGPFTLQVPGARQKVNNHKQPTIGFLQFDQKPIISSTV